MNPGKEDCSGWTRAAGVMPRTQNEGRFEGLAAHVAAAAGWESALYLPKVTLDSTPPGPIFESPVTPHQV